MAAVAAAVVPAVVAKLISVFVALEYVANVPTGGDNIRTPCGANVISMVMSPYKLVSIIDVDAFPPRIPSH